jgi:hypothetical protein
VVAEGVTARVSAHHAWLPHDAVGLITRVEAAVTDGASDLLTGAPRPIPLYDAVAATAGRPVLIIARRRAGRNPGRAVLCRCGRYRIPAIRADWLPTPVNGRRGSQRSSTVRSRRGEESAAIGSAALVRRALFRLEGSDEADRAEQQEQAGGEPPGRRRPEIDGPVEQPPSVDADEEMPNARRSTSDPEGG